jgi:hypothetical protein
VALSFANTKQRHDNRGKPAELSPAREHPSPLFLLIYTNLPPFPYFGGRAIASKFHLIQEYKSGPQQHSPPLERIEELKDLEEEIFLKSQTMLIAFILPLNLELSIYTFVAENEIGVQN